MVTKSEKIAAKILANEPLTVRSLAQEWLRAGPRFADEPAPSTNDPIVRTVAAAVVELLALRANQQAPEWTVFVDGLAEPVYLVDAAKRSAKMRARVERESPEPLRKRNVFAPPGYLEML